MNVTPLPFYHFFSLHLFNWNLLVCTHGYVRMHVYTLATKLRTLQMSNNHFLKNTKA